MYLLVNVWLVTLQEMAGELGHSAPMVWSNPPIKYIWITLDCHQDEDEHIAIYKNSWLCSGIYWVKVLRPPFLYVWYFPQWHWAKTEDELNHYMHHVHDHDDYRHVKMSTEHSRVINVFWLQYEFSYLSQESCQFWSWDIDIYFAHYVY